MGGKKKKKEEIERRLHSVSPPYEKFEWWWWWWGGEGLKLQPHAKAICLGLAVLFEILASVLPNGTVMDTAALPSPIACLPAHTEQQQQQKLLPFFFLLISELYETRSFTAPHTNNCFCTKRVLLSENQTIGGTMNVWIFTPPGFWVVTVKDVNDSLVLATRKFNWKKVLFHFYNPKLTVD